MKNTIRAAIVAGIIGGATLGLAGVANAAVIDQEVVAQHSAAHSQLFAGHKESAGGDQEEYWAQDVAAMHFAQDEGDDHSGETAGNDAEPAANEPAPEQPADEPSDPAPEHPASDTTGDEPATPAADTPDDIPGTDAPDTAPGADDAEPMVADPAPAQASEVEEMTELVTEEMTSETTTSVDEWNHEVTEWNSDWVTYDAYNRPVILNPYDTAMQLFYTYDNAPRIVTVPAGQRVALDVPTTGVYPFTSVVKSPTGPIKTVSVGSFNVPQPGQKPAPATALNNVLVKLNYPRSTSAPFRVKTLADLGDDSAMGARRVLIDGVVSAWGQWSKTPNGEQQFEITKTLQLPGLATPSEAPLPGYNVAMSAR
ncbi:hypothetical protein AB4Z42_04900 [Mycobacterium sp. 2YAF39]|uniref:hypothetical protein n=1 Tax=Mycobacterium sp. 2YAF39 TaxID=3233033 RepID=UPI003F99F14E